MRVQVCRLEKLMEQEIYLRQQKILKAKPLDHDEAEQQLRFKERVADMQVRTDMR